MSEWDDFRDTIMNTATTGKSESEPPVRISAGLSGVELIARERLRQIQVKCWTPEHDDEHTDGSLRVEAAKVACDGTDAHVDDPLERDWGIIAKHGYKGKEPDELHMLAVAGALIAAEIDRKIRAMRRQEGQAR